MQPLWGPPEPFAALLADFEARHPGIRVEVRTLPNDSDLARQAFLTALGGGDPRPDVYVLDVVWVAEFARAGFLRSLEGTPLWASLEPELLPGPAAAARWDGRPWAAPWYVDVGLLYRRTDLVPHAPSTFLELERDARRAMAQDPGLAGLVWQGRQYEGLTVNALESIWGHGGGGGSEGRLALNTPEAVAGVRWLRHTIASGLSPPGTTSGAEEEARRRFQAGRAVFMRNWPYAWAELQREGSPVRGRVGVSALPTLDGHPGPGALGGWMLGLNAHADPAHLDAALALLGHLSGEEAAVTLAVHYARLPARRAIYRSPEVLREAPFIASLLPQVERARPRPVTPYYGLLADTVQGSLSRAVTGVAPAQEALTEAQRLSDAMMGTGP